jgi:UDP-N-acetylmuramate--alanine ligase
MGKIFPDPPSLIYLIGIKGQALTAVAEILLSQGYQVTGSDTAEKFPTDGVLTKLNIDYREVFTADNLTSNIAGVIYSTAYDESNIEVATAKKLGLPMWSYPEFVQILFSLYPKSISVAGSHGKTTTSALLLEVMQAAKFSPTGLIGSTVMSWGSNALVGSSDWFVFETDEYQNKLQLYSPRFAIVTNVDYDHPDFFSDEASYVQAFVDFVSRLPSEGCLVICQDDPAADKLRAATPATVISYGQSAKSDWIISDVRIDERGTHFKISHAVKGQQDFVVPFAGLHYALDAAAVVALADFIGIAPRQASEAIKLFRGTNRRLEKIGEYKGAIIIDDFAHHPTEIHTTLAGLKASYPEKKITTVFHAHTFTRTAKFLTEFAEALSLADKVVLLPIYGSAREAKGQVSSADLAKLINDKTHDKAQLTDSVPTAIAEIKAVCGPEDVVLTLGAGDGWLVAKGLVE